MSTDSQGTESGPDDMSRDCEACYADYQALNPGWVRPEECSWVFDFRFHDRDCAECSSQHACSNHLEYGDSLIWCKECGKHWDRDDYY